MKVITALKAWMQAATVAEQELMAQKVDTSRGMLYQYAGGFREISAIRAGEFEAVSKGMAKASKGRLPELLRTDLCEACRGCQYAQKCLGSRAVLSEFPIVTGDMLEPAIEGGSAD